MNRERAPQTSKRSCARTGRHGFTLVEMMVVIIVIAILAGLLLPAIGGAVRRAKNAKIAMEIASLSKALENYKLENGEYPPDFSMDDADPADTSDRVPKQQAIDQHLSRIFRYRSSGSNHPTDENYNKVALPTHENGGDWLTNEDLDALNPKTALYFWLRGFSASTRQPLTDPTTTRTPVYSFDKGRLNPPNVATQPTINSLASGTNIAIATYYAPGDDTEQPYLYYRATVKNSISTDADAYNTAYQWADNNGVARPYLSNNMVPNPDTNSGVINAYASPKSFQLISAGLDGQYGIGGEYNFSNPTTRTSAINGVFPDGPYSGNAQDPRYGDRDNLTNFSEGSTLKDAQE